MTKEYSDAVFFYGLQVLRNLFQSATTRFELPRGSVDTGVFQRAPAPRPEPSNREHLEARRYVILTGLDAMYGTGPLENFRLDAAFTIIHYASGEDNVIATFPSGNKIPLPAVLNPSEEWRKEMLQYVWYTVEGLAQFLSAHFDGKEVDLIEKKVRMEEQEQSRSIFDSRKLVKLADGADQLVGFPTFEVTEEGEGRLNTVVKE